MAFGSRAWEVFRQLDQFRSGLPVDAYIYASHTEQLPFHGVSWHGRYVGHVDGVGGAHPDGMRYRPPSTAKYAGDNVGHWAIFWEVEALQELSSDARLPFTEFTGFGKRKVYGRNFVPEGPLIVEHPLA